VSVPEAEAGKGVAPDPQLPWEGKARPVDIICFAAIMASTVYFYAIVPFRASLVGTHPVVLELLNGSTEGIIAAAAFAKVGHGTLAVVLLAGVFGFMKFDLLWWWAGRLWGERIIHLAFPRKGRGVRYMARVDRWGRKFLWPAMVLIPFVPIPAAIVYVLAGWAGMSLATFLILDVIGAALWVGTLTGLGYAMGHHAVVVAQKISHYGLWVTIGLIVVVVVMAVRSARAQMRAVQGSRTNEGSAVSTQENPPA
jgi:membrane-associated protein